VERTVTIDGVAVRCGLADMRELSFDATSAENANRVLVRTRAFSCNFRDRSLIRTFFAALPPNRYSGFGSEFVADVVRVGSAVSSLRPGDRVIPDHHIGPLPAPGVRPGIPTNQGSRRMQVHAEEKLMRVPANMPDDEAAAFSLGAQTSYSMIRKLMLSAGARVLVLAARSNTALFTLRALERMPVDVCAVTTSPETKQQLAGAGIRATICLSRKTPEPGDADPLAELATQGGFDAIIDPFFDLHAAQAIKLLRPFGTYVTCGFVAQNPHLARTSRRRESTDLGGILLHAMMNNISIIGNCPGTTDDLRAALTDYERGGLRADHRHGVRRRCGNAFLDRTFNASDRFGKVVYRYVD
jgi:NADPH:quinone reductase-like Zn-dependent oxidoreductase